MNENDNTTSTTLTADQQRKLEAVKVLRRRYEEQRQQVADIEPRLSEYFDHLCSNVSATPDDPHDQHNVYEVLQGVRFLRMLRTYDFNHKKVRQVVRLREGEWVKESTGRWRYISGGLKLPGTSGARVYRWEPFQVYVLATVFGFYAWMNTQVEAGSKSELLPTECERDDGWVWDYRRMVSEYDFFGPRKTDKTGLSAYIQVVFFLLGDYNSEAYCCAMGEQQSKILFKRTKFMLEQLNEDNQFRMTEKLVEWRPQFRNIRASSITPMTAGGKMKDGAFAELCNWDELGNSPDVNGKSDMQQLINVIESSMGPRRQPLTFGTTTAGTIQTGPFMRQLEVLHQALWLELAYEAGTEQPTLAEDRHQCLCLEPDAWERKEEYLLTSHTVRRKVNPMLGVICQHQFYDDWILKARREPDKMAECLSKLFNVYSAAKTIDWIKPDEIRPLQIPVRIDDCAADKGWIVFGGADFSKGDDLNTMGWLAVNMRTKEFFADADCWVSEEAAEKSPVRDLYHQWAAAGWLTIVPGKTFDPAAVVNRVAELTRKGVDIWRIGYDPYNAAIVINALSAYIADMGRKPEQHIMVVKQGYATYTSLVNEFDYMIHRSDPAGKPWPMIRFSMNPMIPWQFGNVALGVSTDGYENKKPIKRNPGSEACKVDSIQAILSALKCYDMVDSGEVSEM